MDEFSTPFDLWLVPEDNDHWPRAYMQLMYDGDEGVKALEFSQREIEDLKHAIAKWEAQFYG